jgi:hypothetical protein
MSAVETDIRNFVNGYVEIDSKYVNTDLICADILTMLKKWYDDHQEELRLKKAWHIDAMWEYINDSDICNDLVTIVLGKDWRYSSGTWCDEHVSYVCEDAQETIAVYIIDRMGL